jgi:hypothetical protein
MVYACRGDMRVDCDVTIVPAPSPWSDLGSVFGERLRSCAECLYVGRWVFGLGWDFGHVKLASLLFAPITVIVVLFSSRLDSVSLVVDTVHHAAPMGVIGR